MSSRVPLRSGTLMDTTTPPKFVIDTCAPFLFVKTYRSAELPSAVTPNDFFSIDLPSNVDSLAKSKPLNKNTAANIPIGIRIIPPQAKGERSEEHTSELQSP